MPRLVPILALACLTPALACLTSGCEAAGPLLLDHVVPGVGSARGGEEITLVGTGFVPGSTVRLGDRSVSASWFDAETIVAFTPPGFAGPVDVTVVRPDGAESTVRGGFSYLAFDVWFRDALASALPIGGSGLYESVGSGDIDGDFDEDLVVAGPLVGAVLWENTELGRFRTKQQIPGAVSALAVHDLDGDGLADAFLCGADGAFDRLLLGSADGLTEVSEALPPIASACHEARVADVDGDGRSDLVLLGEDEDGAGSPRSHVRVLLGRGGPGAPRFVLHDGIEAAASLAGVAFGEAIAEGQASGAQLVGSDGLGFGDGAGRLTGTVAASGDAVGARFGGAVGHGRVFEAPTGARVQVLGGGAGLGLTLRLEDGNGELFTWALGTLDGGAASFATGPLDGATSTGDGVFDVPVESVAVLAVASGPGAVDLAIDDVVLETASGAYRIEDFERREFSLAASPPETSLAVGDLDLDGDLDLALGGPAGVRLALQAPGDLDASDGTAGSLPGEPLMSDEVESVAVLPHGGAVDLLAVGPETRLFRLVQGAATEVSEELPAGVGGELAVAAGDLDRDGRPDALLLRDGDRDGILHRSAEAWQDWTARLPAAVDRTVAATLIDVDRDGDDDLLLLNEDAPHRLLLSHQDPLPE